MPENQSQAHTGGDRNPDGGPNLTPQPDAEPRAFDRPSDVEAAHAPDEGEAVRGAAVSGDDSADPNWGSLEGREGRDPRQDYATAGHRDVMSQDRETFQGTDRNTAGAAFADRMPEASKTETDADGRPIEP
jgi:hypothetical protein